MKFLYLLLFLIVGSYATAQTYDVEFVGDSNNLAKTKFYITVRIKSTAATFNLGSSNFTYDFNDNALNPLIGCGVGQGTPRIIHNFSGGLYSAMNYTYPITIGGVGSISINIEYNGGVGSGTVVTNAWMNVATIEFDIVTPSDCANLAFRSPSAPLIPFVCLDDADNDIPRNSAGSMNRCPLPVEFIYFSATPSGNNAVLDWATATEISNYGFEIQRYNEAGRNWDNIGFVGTKANGGNANYRIDYFNTDNDVYNPSFGPATFYYRLRQIDYNGEFAYSEIKSASFSPGQAPASISANIYPNPASSKIWLDLNSTMTNNVIRVEIFDQLGKSIYSDYGYNHQQIDVGHLAQGMYTVKILNATTVIKTQNLIIAR